LLRAGAEGGRVSILTRRVSTSKKMIPFKNNRSKTHFAYLSKMRFLITLILVFVVSNMPELKQYPKLTK